MDNFKSFLKLTIFVLLIFWLIKIFDISYPLTITTRTQTTELSVVGQGKVEAIPDVFYISTGIYVDNKKTVKEVQDQINSTNEKIVQAIKNLGIKKEDIKTTNYSIYPKTIYDKNGNSQVVGYSGRVDLRIKIKDNQLLSKVVEKVVAAGANQIYGISSEIENPEKYQQQARQIAISNAKSEAYKLAKSLGIKLGKITNIVESKNDTNYPMMFTKTGGGNESAASFEPGTQTVSSTVTLFFEKK
ncbi:MAG: SIMPL domain-containing protein [Microgenomates group bacterium]